MLPGYEELPKISIARSRVINNQTSQWLTMFVIHLAIHYLPLFYKQIIHKNIEWFMQQTNASRWNVAHLNRARNRFSSATCDINFISVFIYSEISSTIQNNTKHQIYDVTLRYKEHWAYWWPSSVWHRASASAMVIMFGFRIFMGQEIEGSVLRNKWYSHCPKVILIYA